MPRRPAGLLVLCWLAQASGDCIEGVREVRVWDRGGDFLHVAEVQLLDASGANVALEAKPMASSTTLVWGQDVSVVVDGDVDQARYWHSERAAASEWLRLALPRDVCVVGARLFGRSDHDTSANSRQGGLVLELRSSGGAVLNSTDMDLSLPPHRACAGVCPALALGEGKVPLFDPDRLHIVFSTECNAYFDWQSAGLFYSIKAAYAADGLQPPRTTRLSACAEDNRKMLRPELHSPGWAGYHPKFDTYVHPLYTVNRCPDDATDLDCNRKDRYSAYNKPGSVTHWLEHSGTSAEFVAFLDADQVLVHPINPVFLGARAGRPVSALYAYLKGVRDDVHMGVKARMVAAKRNHAPFEQAGGFFIFHTADLRRVAPLWLRYTQRVRADPDSWANTGDLFNCRGAPAGCQGKECKCPGPPWISEMYGYVFGASEANLTHVIDNRVMLYPGYAADHLKEPYPLVLHYGITAVMDLGPGKGYWAFDKHWYQGPGQQSIMACPGAASGKQKFREPPPVASVLAAESVMSDRSRRLVIYCIWTLHNATVSWQQWRCPGGATDVVPYSTQRPWRCRVDADVLTCREAAPGAELGGGGGSKGDDGVVRGSEAGVCEDTDTRGFCCAWAAAGHCTSNAAYMATSCRRACKLCSTAEEPCRSEQPRPIRRGTPTAVTFPWVAVSGWLVALLLFLKMFGGRRSR